MSHESEIPLTNCTNWDVAVLALNALGLAVDMNSTVIQTYYSRINSKKDPHVTALGAVHVKGKPHANYKLGMRKANDGSIEFVGDFWGIACKDNGKAMLETMGKGFSQYGSHNVRGRLEHFAKGKPTRFQQEYLLQGWQLECQKKRMAFSRVTKENGDIVLTVRGGKFPPGAYAELTAKADGSSLVAGFEFVGNVCKTHTAAFEAFAGVASKVNRKKEWFHKVANAVVKHVRH